MPPRGRQSQAIDAAPRLLQSSSGVPPRPAPVAQLDRASVYETEGHRFESCRARSSDRAVLPANIRKTARRSWDQLTSPKPPVCPVTPDGTIAQLSRGAELGSHFLRPKSREPSRRMAQPAPFVIANSHKSPKLPLSSRAGASAPRPATAFAFAFTRMGERAWGWSATTPESPGPGASAPRAKQQLD